MRFIAAHYNVSIQNMTDRLNHDEWYMNNVFAHRRNAFYPTPIKSLGAFVNNGKVELLKQGMETWKICIAHNINEDNIGFSFRIP